MTRPIVLPSVVAALPGPAHPLESVTIGDLARDHVTEPEYFEYPGVTACLPGDEPHLLARMGRNPIPGVSAQRLARALRDGEIKDRGLARRVMVYVDHYQRRLGQAFYNGRNHDAIPDDISEFPAGFNHADPYQR